MSAFLHSVSAAFWMVGFLASVSTVLWIWVVDDAPRSSARWPFRLALFTIFTASALGALSWLAHNVLGAA